MYKKIKKIMAVLCLAIMPYRFSFGIAASTLSFHFGLSSYTE